MDSVNTTKKQAGPLRNQHGGVIGIIVLLLALIGAWYLYQSYTRGRVKSNLKSITNLIRHNLQPSAKCAPGAAHI